MRKQLMAAVLLPLGIGLAGVTQAQSSTPAYQNTSSEAQRKAGNSQATAELFYMIQQLQREVRDLRGKVEEQEHQITRLQQQGRDRYVDLDQRILELSKSIENREAAAGQPDSESADGNGGRLTPARVYRSPEAEEQERYNQIIDLIRNKKDFDSAITQLYEFVDKYPEGDLTVNAYYWLGEVYLAKPQLEQAQQAFTIVSTRYADHRKAPDAVYKLGVTLDKLGEKSEARRRMNMVVQQYPKSGAADLAKKYLESNQG
ncbi:tol-pal system protein YbgF [Marinobacter daepoensis]|uniref:Cell division coordinator CpoB n=1 Tax=Marinobacter daepoensis TaxID=262077 RepID=A0ABS3BCT1_9GAMM|nr:tol-pal system protein YbgF [Marinobacter daepoensis]MBN7769363.1 tol-pal system protein YbgF [Marinobacter daepoensis]MBY6031975.1 tol-pal system protein YbgF [Marinobacter daepoensis]MBY6078053.1 tol-pal system protein YbgF [Marinobacter daepoensis]